MPQFPKGGGGITSGCLCSCYLQHLPADLWEVSTTNHQLPREKCKTMHDHKETHGHQEEIRGANVATIQDGDPWGVSAESKRWRVPPWSPQMLMNQGCEHGPQAVAIDVLWSISTQTVTLSSFKELCTHPWKAPLYRGRLRTLLSGNQTNSSVVVLMKCILQNHTVQYTSH